uniref:Uncharacterized protein n=1 Tax=Ditylenchus dipsaci TaxID=166011 RepID=A0A915DDZ3_9BILA
MDNHVYQETEFVNINENNYEQPKGPIETPSPYGKKTFDIDGSCVTNDLLSKSLWLKNSISKKKLVVSALVLIGTALVVASLIYFFTDYAVLPKSGVETKEKLIRTLEDQLNQSNLKANYQNFNSQLAQSCYKEVSLLQNHTRELIQVISLQNKHINQSGATVDKLQDEIQTWMAETERMKQLEKLLTQQINETTLDFGILASTKNIQLEQQEIEIKNQSQVIEAQKLTIANLSTALGLQKNLTSIANSLMLARDQEISKLNQENSKQLVVLGTTWSRCGYRML